MQFSYFFTLLFLALSTLLYDTLMAIGWLKKFSSRDKSTFGINYTCNSVYSFLNEIKYMYTFMYLNPSWKHDINIYNNKARYTHISTCDDYNLTIYVEINKSLYKTSTPGELPARCQSYLRLSPGPNFTHHKRPLFVSSAI